MSRRSEVCWIFLWITAADAYYTISSRTYTWEEAITKGNIATPSIEMNNSSLTVNITVDVNNKEAWVGYYLKETAFAYIGCGRVNNAEPKTLLPINVNSPGLCYSMCEKSHINYIGLSYGNCSCMREKPSGEDIYHQECNYSPYGNWIAGGGDGYLSIYEIMKPDIDITISDSGGKCLIFQNNNQRWWGRCNQSNHLLCKKGADIFTVSRNNQRWLEWSYYVQSCFKNKSFPISYNDIMHTYIELATGPTWTNVIRSGVIYKYNEISSSIDRENLVKYGYVNKSGSSVYLNFTSMSERKWYILQTLPVASPTSEQVQTSTPSHISHKLTTISTRIALEKGTVTKDPTSSPTVTSTSMIYSTSSKGPGSYTTTTSSTNDVSINSSDVSVPVSISAVAIMLLVVIVVIITLKRRGTIQTKCCRNVQSNSSDYATPEMHLAVQGDYSSLSPNYDQINVVELPSTAYADYNGIHDKNEHLYSDLEKHGGGSYININIESHDNKY